MNDRRSVPIPLSAAVRGSVLPITLVLLVAMALAAVGLMKSVDTSTLLARNTSFQRDAVNRNEIVVRQVMREFESAAGRHFRDLDNTTTHALGVAGGMPYRATALPTDPTGVPAVLRDPAAYAAMFGGVATTSAVSSGEGMTTTYVIDRLCSLEDAATEQHCVVSSARAPDNCSRCSTVSSPFAPIFRVSARTTGPRGVEAFSQATFTLPME
jgi:type IV pilus assembly protein PilX